MERLSSLDAGFLHLENDRQQMHVGSLLLFEGPTPSFAAFTAHLSSCLDKVPRYRQQVRRTPVDLGRPVWVDDPHFELSYHLRHTAIPSPGGDAQLKALIGRVMSQRLDVDRPLWELWLVEGLPDDRWAVITKTHHAMVDGLAGNELMEIVLSRDPESVPAEPRDWSPEPQPSNWQLASSGLAGLAHIPMDLTKSVVSTAKGAASSKDGARGALARVFGLASVGPTMARPTSVLNGPLGPHRRWDWARASLDDIKRAKNAFGCTVNDVVLAGISGGLRTYLQSRGEDVDAATIRSLVPVSIRTPDHKGRLGNQVTGLFADLPVDCADPVERVDAVTRQMNTLKQSGQAVGVDAMLSAADFVPPTLMTLGARVYVMTGQRVVNIVTTNIPGPQYPLYLLGCRMLEMFPYIPIGQDVRISIGIVSYDGQLAIGATGDYDAVPDLDVLCRAIEDSLAEIVHLADEA